MVNKTNNESHVSHKYAPSSVWLLMEEKWTIYLQTSKITSGKLKNLHALLLKEPVLLDKLGIPDDIDELYEWVIANATEESLSRAVGNLE